MPKSESTGYASQFAVWPAAQERARAATHLERDDDALADLQAAHAVAERHDLGDALVPERERLADREDAGRQRQVDVAARDRERTHEGVAVASEPRLGNVTPFDGAGSGTGELSHGCGYPAPRPLSQTISLHARLRATQSIRRPRYASASTSQSRSATMRGSSSPSGRHTR